MLNLPRSTEVNLRIQKQKLYSDASLSPLQKNMLKTQIETIYWRNKLSESTCNIETSETTDEIQIIEIKSRQPNIDNQILSIIEKIIPYKILFIVSCEDNVQMWVKAFGKFFKTDWQQKDSITLELKGLNLDAVWENIIVQVGGVQIANGNTLDEQIEVDDRRQRLEKEISRLDKLAWKEKQPKKKSELAQEINRLKKELEGL